MATDSPPITTSELEELQEAKPPDTKEELEKFVRWRVQQYKIHKFRTLSDVFADDFALYVREDFEVLSKDVITSLRDCLRANGAYVKKGRGLSMAKELADVIKEEIPWPPDDEDRPPPKPSHYYPQQQQQQLPPQQQYHHPQQQPIQPYRPENTVPLPPQQPYQQPYRPENTIPLPPQPPYRPENPTPILSPTPAYGPPRQPQQQPMQSIQQQQPEDTTALPPPPTTNYGPDYRVPHLLPSPYQVIQDFGTKQNYGHSKELTTLAKLYTSEEKYGGNPTESLSYKFTIFMDLCTRAEIPQQILQTAHFLASWLASPLGYIRDTKERKATGQG